MNSLRRLVHGLRVFDRAVERAAGLSGAQLFVLSKLRGARPVSINELAERTCTHQSSVSVVARKLVEQSLARRARAPQDGRVVHLTVTAAGRNALALAPPAAQDKLIAAIERLTAPDRRQLDEILQELVAAAGLDGGLTPFFFEGSAAPLPRR